MTRTSRKTLSAFREFFAKSLQDLRFYLLIPKSLGFWRSLQGGIEDL
jgi:hypothetical protein